ncbi:MAG: hypothetical protein IPQ02_02930 [Saprospiraceae bacterium]|nr:hypothetical protein [Candidatus Defluviibacterium haderslevense]
MTKLKDLQKLMNEIEILGNKFKLSLKEQAKLQTFSQRRIEKLFTTDLDFEEYEDIQKQKNDLNIEIKNIQVKFEKAKNAIKDLVPNGAKVRLNDFGIIHNDEQVLYTPLTSVDNLEKDDFKTLEVAFLDQTDVKSIYSN